jgi:thiamine biosynthesis lipoprotein
MKHLIFSGLAIFFVLIVGGCSSKSKEYVYNEGKVFGTFYHFVYDGGAGDKHDEIKALLESFNKSLSTYDTLSTISRFNRGEKDVVADPYFTRVFNTAAEVSEKSNGAFDMTVAPLVNAWGFGFSKMDQVTDQVIDSLKQFVGMQYVSIKNGFVVSTKTGVMLDASAIAKGYGVDVVAEFLKDKGVSNYMVEIGGEVVTAGVNPKGNLWRIGIDKPVDDPMVINRELQLIIQISGKGLATSGNYRNFYVKDGKKFAHTINPKTGYPVQHSLLSASIIANDCMTADAYATACMVIGLDESMALIESLPGIEGCFIYQTDSILEVKYTSGFGQFIDFSE